MRYQINYQNFTSHQLHKCLLYHYLSFFISYIILQDASPFFMKEGGAGAKKGPIICPAPIDRYATNTSQFLFRENPPRTYPHCWIDDQWQREPPKQHNTCRLGASLRWGPPKTGIEFESKQFAFCVSFCTNVTSVELNNNNSERREG